MTTAKPREQHPAVAEVRAQLALLGLAHARRGRMLKELRRDFWWWVVGTGLTSALLGVLGTAMWGG